MNSFSSAYSNSRDEVKASKQALVEQQHYEIVNAMKKTFGIDSFSALNESDRESYRAMLHKMWNKESGLTEYGVKFINESQIPLTESSNPDQIVKALKAKARQAMPNILAKLSSGNDAGSILGSIYNEVKKEAGAGVTKDLAKAAFTDVIIAAIKPKLKF